jgi:hypothetical protein
MDNESYYTALVGMFNQALTRNLRASRSRARIVCRAPESLEIEGDGCINDRSNPRALPKLPHRCNFLPCASLRTAETWTVLSDFNDSFWTLLAELFRGR